MVLRFVKASTHGMVGIRLGFVALVIAAGSVQAQEIDGPIGGVAGYNSGDLLLVFYSAGAANDLVFDIGNASSFTGAAPGTYTVAEFNGSTTAGQPAVGSGNADYISAFTSYNSSTRWTIAGGNSETGEVYLTSTSSNGIQKAQTDDIQGALADEIDTIGDDAEGNPDTHGANPGDALLSDKPVFNGIDQVTHIWMAGEQVVDTATAGTSSLVLWDLVPTSHGTANGVEVGTFTLDAGSGILTFSPATNQTGPATRLVNISSRADIGTGANLEIAGFVVSGPVGSTEQVLVRAVGPTLSQFGVGGALAQPVLTLFNSAGSQLATNTGWQTAANSAEIASAAISTGAFSLASGSADSAILVNLAPGGYTAQITGVGGTTGVGLAEVYEVTSGSAKLINISTRAFVGTGANVEIGGFVVRGSQSTEVLVRAVGPALGQFGVTGTLVQPSLSVVNSSGTAVASNTGWSTNANAAAIASETSAVGAFSLPSGSADCALLLTLSPGAYTAVVSGVNGTSGVALVEVYQVQSD